MRLICKVPGRITVAEFKRAVKATGLKPVRGEWCVRSYTPKRLCAACGLIIVGVHRNYFGTSLLTTMMVDKCRFILGEEYVEGFIQGFDDAESPEFAQTAEEEQGRIDGRRCAAAVAWELEESQ